MAKLGQTFTENPRIRLRDSTSRIRRFNHEPHGAVVTHLWLSPAVSDRYGSVIVFSTVA